MQAHPSQETSTNATRRILVIDDDQDDFLLVKSMLKEAKGRTYEVSWASTYETGREALYSDQYNAVMVDYDLGAHTGIDLIREATERGYYAPLILFTGRGSYEVDVEAMEAGATLYLTKGEANPLLLERAIRYAIELKQKEHTLRESEAALRRSSEALRESEARERAKVEEMNAILDAVPAIVLVTHDRQASQVTGNQAAHDFLLVPNEKNLSKSAPEDAPKSYQVYKEGRELATDELPLQITAATGRPIRNVEEEVIFENGDRAYLLGNVTPLVDDYGSPNGAVAAYINISERKQAEEALRVNEEMLRLALIAGQAGAWSWDLTTNVLHWSDQYYRIFGFEPGSIQPTPEAGFSHVHPADRPRIEAIVRDAIERGTQIDEVHQVIWPDGSVHWVRGISRAFYNEHKQPYRMAGIAMDITEQKQAEIELQAANRRTTEILESISDAFYSLDLEDRFTYVNQKAARLWKIQPEEVLGKIIWEVFPAGKNTESYHKMHQAMLERKPIQYESYSAFLNEWVDVHLYPTDQGISVYFQDITERKRAEAALREVDSRYSALFNAKTNGIAHCQVLVDAQGQPIDYIIVEINDAYETITGIKRADIEGRRATEVFPGIENFAYDYIGNYGRVALQGGELNFETYFEGTGQWLAIYIYRTRPGEFTAIFTDITPRKQAQQTLLESEQQYREMAEALHESEAKLKAHTRELETILDAMPAYIWITHDPQAREMTGNQPVFDLMHKAPGTNLSKTSQEADQVRNFKAMHAGQEIPDEQLPVQLVAASGVPIRDYEFDMVFEDGTIHHLLGNVSPLFDETGQPAGAVSAFIDITARKLFQKKLIESEYRFRVALASAPITVFTTDQQLRVTWMYDPQPGFQLENIIGLRLDQVTPEDHGRKITAMLQSVIDSGQPMKGEMETVSYGKPTHFAYYIDPILDSQGTVTGLACAGYDITDRKQAEKDLQHYAEELERSNQALSDFAFIASHDLQEPLRKIIMFGNSLQKLAASSLTPEAKDYLERMQSAAERMQAMINGLLELSRVNTQSVQFNPIDLTRVVKEAVAELDMKIHASGGQVQIADLPTIEADELQMRQLFQNLIGNAIKFQQPGIAPQIRVSATLDPSFQPEMVEIRVEDNGIGFEQQNAERIFQPFSRLHGRSEYEGTGLGLAICQKIIERHHGKIEVHSVTDQGTTFIIRLPSRVS